MEEPCFESHATCQQLIEDDSLWIKIILNSCEQYLRMEKDILYIWFKCMSLKGEGRLSLMFIYLVNIRV